MNRYVPWRTRTAVVVVAAASLGGLAACTTNLSSSSAASGSAPSSAPSSAPAGTGAASSSSGGGTVAASACGDKPGVKATGTPINLGSIDTKQPGTDFSDIQNMTAAYFACLNDNGGINGHPVKYTALTEQTNPSQITSLAKQLVTSDHVVGIVGNSSIIECSVDAAYWKSVGIEVLGAGIDPECWSTPDTASVNMGPRYSSDGATEYVLTNGATKIAFDQSNVPGTGYIAGGPQALAKAKGVQIQTFTENVPITSANAIATKLVTAAGPNGAVVLNFTPPQAQQILQAAQKLNLQNRVKYWACSTPCNTDFLAKSLGPKWNNKLFVNSELAPLDGNNSQAAQLFQAVLKQYGSSRVRRRRLVLRDGLRDRRARQAGPGEREGRVHDRVGQRRDQGAQATSTPGLMCQGFTYGDYAEHIPNNMDFTVTPSNGQFVQARGCTLIPSVDPQIAAYRKIAGTAPAVYAS